MTCRSHSHDWKPALRHAKPLPGNIYLAHTISFVCRKCSAWRDGPYDADAWAAHVNDVVERMQWDAALARPAATVGT